MATGVDNNDGTVWNMLRRSLRQRSISSSSTNQVVLGSDYRSGNSVSTIAKSIFSSKRRLHLDPSKKIYFPFEPGKQVRSAIEIKNTSKSNVAFKFQTTAPKSCYMRPPGGVLTSGETVTAIVFKFVEPPESNDRNPDKKIKVKFKIMSLKVHGETDYVPELFDELKEQVLVERILRVVFLDPECPSPELEKLKIKLDEADAELEARNKKPAEDNAIVGNGGLVLDEWKERRERYLAAQQQQVQ